MNSKSTVQLWSNEWKIAARIRQRGVKELQKYAPTAAENRANYRQNRGPDMTNFAALTQAIVGPECFIMDAPHHRWGWLTAQGKPYVDTCQSCQVYLSRPVECL